MEYDLDRHLDKLTGQLASMTATVIRDTSITTPNLNTILRFINRVVQVADKAIQKTYKELIDVQFQLSSAMWRANALPLNDQLRF